MTRTPTKSLVGKLVRAAFGILGVAFLAIAFANTWDGSVAEVTIPWWRVAGALPLASVALACGFRAWAALLGSDRRLLAWGFYFSQLGKYIPGGVWQAAGQVGYTARADVPVARATTAFALFAVTQSAAGGTLGALAAIVIPYAPPLARLAALAGLALILLLHRRWMLLVLTLVRRIRHHDDAEELLPPQRWILRSWLWSLGTMAGYGAAFALLVTGLDPAVSPLEAVPASAFAWTIGFLALPVPSGIGVREAGLIALLGPVAGTSTVIVASLYHRLVTITGEGLMILGSSLQRNRRSAPTEFPPEA